MRQDSAVIMSLFDDLRWRTKRSAASMDQQSTKLSLEDEPTFFGGRTTFTILASFDVQIKFVFTPLFKVNSSGTGYRLWMCCSQRKVRLTNALLQTGQPKGNSLA